MVLCLHSVLWLAAVAFCASALFDLEAISFRLKPITESKLCDAAILSKYILWVLI